MKYILLLLLTSFPLAVLTVRSFVDLAAVAEQAGSLPLPAELDTQQASADAARAQVKADQPLVKALAEADLLAAQPIPALQGLPPNSSLTFLGARWSQWMYAQRMAGKVIEVEQRANTSDLQQLSDACRQWTKLRSDYADLSPRGSQGLLLILERRQAELQAKIGQRQAEQATGETLSQAIAALEGKQYDECTRLCDQLLAKGGQSIEAAVRSQVQALRARAQFRRDAELLPKKLAEAKTPPARAALLRSFLAAHRDRAGWTAEETRIAEGYLSELRGLEKQMEAIERSQSAKAALEKFRQQLPGDLSQRLAGALEIADRYAQEDVKAELRGEVRRWLAELLPEKKIAESPALREMETKKQEIIRGFIKEVKIPDGTSGYKRYSTYEQYLHPDVEVGTYRQDVLLRPPGESVPRQCVARYEEARRRLLEHPQQREAWTQMADLCQALDAALLQYRAKPGSSTEGLSFAREEKSLRHLVDAPVWDGLSKLFGP